MKKKFPEIQANLKVFWRDLTFAELLFLEKMRRWLCVHEERDKIANMN